MPNLYVSLNTFKAELGAQSGGSSSDGRDAGFLRALEWASRTVDRATGRHFYSVTGVRYVAGGALGPINLGADGWGYGLVLPFDVVSLTEVATDQGGGTFGGVLAYNTDYFLYDWNRPDNTPARILLNNRYSTVATTFPTIPRGTRLAGIFGYSDERELVTTATEALDTSETGVDFTVAEPLVSAGDTIVIDSEQMYVSAAQGGTLTVQRAQNGTTAATHLTSAPIYRRRYERDVEKATLMQAVRFWREQQTGGAGSQGGEFGSSFSTTYPALREMIDRLSLPVLR